MSTSTYYLRPQTGVLFHGGQTTICADIDEGFNAPADVQALVASGDCFITLATQVDAVTDQLSINDLHLRPQMEELAATLLYLQRYYEIHHKSVPDVRQ